MAFDPALQAQLDDLWFRMPPSTPAGEQARRQRSLLREFQICASQPLGAVDPANGGPVEADRLRQVELTAAAMLRTDYVPAGLADIETRAAISAWHAAWLRRPVIFEQRKKSKNDWPTIASSGFTFPGEVATAADRVFVRDFTAERLPPGGTPAPTVVGEATNRGKGKEPRWENVAVARHGRTKITPQSLTGGSWEALDGAQATFRVIYAVAKVETGGAFDSINAWDTSVLSVGPYQYTAFPQPGGADPQGTGPAELGAFLAYFRSRGTSHEDEYRRLFKMRGIHLAGAWGGHMQTSNHTYVAQLLFADDATGTGRFARPADKEARDWLRSWPVIHRVREAIRVSDRLREAMWPFARQRLRDVLAIPWPAGGPPGAAVLGDAFKSELSAALLLRWHVFRPAHLVRATNNAAVEIVRGAGLQTKRVSTWTNDDEEKLIAAFDAAAGRMPLKAEVSKSLRHTLAAVRAWSHPEWGALGRTRTFVMAKDGIPFPNGTG